MLGLEAEWSTVADLTRDRRFVVGRGFAGCLYTVLDPGNGQYKCVHTARPSTSHPEETVDKLITYVRGKKWRVVHEVQTAEFIGNENGCVQVFCVTRVDFTINPRPMVHTARLQVNTVGQIVHADVFTNY